MAYSAPVIILNRFSSFILNNINTETQKKKRYDNRNARQKHLVGKRHTLHETDRRRNVEPARSRLAEGRFAMTLSYYLIKYPYTLTWRIVNLFRRTDKTVLYCEDVLDVELFSNIQKHLKKVQIVAKNSTVQRSLLRAGYYSKRWPAFPNTVIMFRNSAWRFPSPKIKKIGLEHGAYNFKRFSKAKYYNMFDVFLMTSEIDVERVKKRGVRTAKSIGYPKIDSVYNGSITKEELYTLAARIGLNKSKKTVLFSSTWDGSGMSAIEKWYDKIGQISDRYNLLATVHNWMSEKYKIALKNNPKIIFINDNVILKYILLSDVCVGDTNSLIAEFCMLDKPVITFRIPQTPRTLPDVIEIIEKVSIRIDAFSEIENAIERALNNPGEFAEARKELTDLMLDNRDGNAGHRAAAEILKFSPNLKITDH
ncbi:MAG: CDP-glycerol glycerophosphotransferase family protein [bacterium]